MNQSDYERQHDEFLQAALDAGRITEKWEKMPILNDDTETHTQNDYSFDYLAHCCWAARMLAKTMPKRHIDFASYTYFSGIVSAFIPTTFADIRHFGTRVPGLTVEVRDLTAAGYEDGSWESVSCLHSLEHVGLGRYGDALDVNGDVKAARELWRIVAPGGQLLMVLPMNRESRTSFNAHRIYDRKQVTEMLFPDASIAEQSVILPNGFMHDGPEPYGDYTACLVFRKEK